MQQAPAEIIVCRRLHELSPALHCCLYIDWCDPLTFLTHAGPFCSGRRAWESLGQRDGGTLRAGLELAKKLQRAIVQCVPAATLLTKFFATV